MLFLLLHFTFYIFLSFSVRLFSVLFHQSFSFISVHKSLTLISHKKLSKYLLKYISRCVFRLQINFAAFKNYIFHVEAYTQTLRILWTFIAFFPSYTCSFARSFITFPTLMRPWCVGLCVCVCVAYPFSLFDDAEKNVQSINKPAYHMNVIAYFRYFINTEWNEWIKIYVAKKCVQHWTMCVCVWHFTYLNWQGNCIKNLLLHICKRCDLLFGRCVKCLHPWMMHPHQLTIMYFFFSVLCGNSCNGIFVHFFSLSPSLTRSFVRLHVGLTAVVLSIHAHIAVNH